MVQTRASLISAGTERSLVEFGRAGLISKARQKPDQVKRVLDKIASDGLLPTLEAVFSRLDEPMPLGYCNAGVVVEAGADVERFAEGDRVVSNGMHAEMVHAPVNLCAKIPPQVSDENASFAVLGAIDQDQGLRLRRPGGAGQPQRHRLQHAGRLERRRLWLWPRSEVVPLRLVRGPAEEG